MRLRLFAIGAASLIATACSRMPPPAPPLPQPQPTVKMTLAPMPAGARAGMRIPARLADGRWATPNVGLSAAGNTWHLRAALNVAVLACHGPDQAVMVNEYNSMLSARKAELAAAQAALQQEYRAARGTQWEDAFDDQMTRLYNFFAQDFAHQGFCGAARDALGSITGVPGAGLAAFAAQQLPLLEAPFTDFFTAYDRWQSGALMRAADAPAPLSASG